MLRRFGELLLIALTAIALQFLFLQLSLTPLVLASSGIVFSGLTHGRLGLQCLGGMALVVAVLATAASSPRRRLRICFGDAFWILSQISTALWLFSLVILMWWVLPGLAGHAVCLRAMHRLQRAGELDGDLASGRKAGRLATFWSLSFMGPPVWMFLDFD